MIKAGNGVIYRENSFGGMVSGLNYFQFVPLYIGIGYIKGFGTIDYIMVYE